MQVFIKTVAKEVRQRYVLVVASRKASEPHKLFSRLVEDQ